MGGHLNWDLDRLSYPVDVARDRAEQEDAAYWRDRDERPWEYEWTDEQLDAMDEPHDGLRGEAE